eukprot:3598125-Pleurochrysis_carterae.AAC.1
MENGYNIWSSHGRPLGHVKQDKFFQFLWRPRPPSMLSEAKEKEARTTYPPTARLGLRGLCLSA